MILAYVNGSVGYVAIVSLVIQTWLMHVAACAVRCYVLGVNKFKFKFHCTIRNTTVANAGKTYIVYIIYMYATQQDAPHRNNEITYYFNFTYPV
jgi:hypothetical protein